MRKFLKAVDFTAPYIGAALGFVGGFTLTWQTYSDLYTTVVLTGLISLAGAMLGAGVSDIAFKWLTELDG